MCTICISEMIEDILGLINSESTVENLSSEDAAELEAEEETKKHILHKIK